MKHACVLNVTLAADTDSGTDPRVPDGALRTPLHGAVAAAHRDVAQARACLLTHLLTLVAHHSITTCLLLTHSRTLVAHHSLATCLLQVLAGCPPRRGAGAAAQGRPRRRQGRKGADATAAGEQARPRQGRRPARVDARVLYPRAGAGGAFRPRGLSLKSGLSGMAIL